MYIYNDGEVGNSQRGRTDMDMNYMIVPGIIVALGGGAILVKLLEIGYEIRKGLIDKTVFSSKSFAPSIREIYRFAPWQRHFDGYYVISRRINGVAYAFAVAGLAMVILLVIVEGQAASIAKVRVDHDVSLLYFLRIVHFLFVILWVVLLFVCWRWALDTKNELDAA